MDLRKYDLTPEEAQMIRQMDGAMLGSSELDRMYADRDGEPISFGVWMVLFSKESYKRVADTTIGEGIRVSTIWFGMPWLRMYETALVLDTDENTGPNYDHIYGWHSPEEAKEGHAAIVRDLVSHIPDAVVVDHG